MNKLERLTKRERTLIEENMGILYQVAWKYAAGKEDFKEMVQEGIFYFMKAVKKWDPQKGFLYNYAYAYLNTAIKTIKKKKKVEARIQDIPMYPTQTDYFVQDSINQALNKLSPLEKEVILKYYGFFGKYDSAEIGTFHNVTKQYIHIVRYRALRKLRRDREFIKRVIT